MLGTFIRIVRNFRHNTVHKPIANGVKHRLMFGHRVDDAFRVFGPPEGQSASGKSGQIRPVIPTAQAMQRIVAVMDGAGFAREQTVCAHDRLLNITLLLLRRILRHLHRCKLRL